MAALHRFGSPGAGKESSPEIPPFSSGDTVFIYGGPASGRIIAENALRAGVQVWLDDPGSWSLADFRALLALAEESGVEACVSRPWRMSCQDSEARFRLLQIDASIERDFSAGLGATIDLATWLCSTGVLQRVDAERIVDGFDRPRALLATVRFQSGAMAHISLVAGAESRSCRISGGNQAGWQEIGGFAGPEPQNDGVLEAFCAHRPDHRRAHLADAISSRVIEEKIYAVLRGV